MAITMDSKTSVTTTENGPLEDGLKSDDIQRNEEGSKKSHCTPWLVLTVFSVVIGSSLQCGITISVINRHQDFIDHFYNISSETILIQSLGRTNHWGLIVAVYAFGGLLGSFIGGRLANLFGSRNSLIFNNIFVLLGGITYIVAINPNVLLPDLFILARILTGINFGMSLVNVPMYLAEISPTDVRGAVCGFHQFGLTFGLFLMQVLGLPNIFGEFSWWSFLFGTIIAVIPFQLFTLPFCPKSPRHLVINHGNITEAKKGLQKLRVAGYDIDTEVSIMRNEKALTQKKTNILQVFLNRSLRKPLALSIVVQIIQQTNGMITIFAYSNVIFDSAGLPKNMSGYGTAGTGLICFSVSLLCVFLIDKYGRRLLFLTGLSLQSMSYIILAVAMVTGNPDVKGDWSGYVSIIFMCLAVAFSVLYINIPWYITAELFTQGPRAAAMTISGMSNRVCNFSISFIFPSLKAAFGNYTFLYFALSCMLYWIVIYLFLPETKNKTFLEIQRHFDHQRKEVVLDENLEELHNIDRITSVKEKDGEFEHLGS